MKKDILQLKIKETTQFKNRVLDTSAHQTHEKMFNSMVMDIQIKTTMSTDSYFIIMISFGTGIELRTSHLPGRCCATELHPRPHGLILKRGNTSLIKLEAE